MPVRNKTRDLISLCYCSFHDQLVPLRSKELKFILRSLRLPNKSVGSAEASTSQTAVNLVQLSLLISRFDQSNNLYDFIPLHLQQRQRASAQLCRRSRDVCFVMFLNSDELSNCRLRFVKQMDLYTRYSSSKSSIQSSIYILNQDEQPSRSGHIRVSMSSVLDFWNY